MNDIEPLKDLARSLEEQGRSALVHYEGRRLPIEKIEVGTSVLRARVKTGDGAGNTIIIRWSVIAAIEGDEREAVVNPFDEF